MRTLSLGLAGRPLSACCFQEVRDSACRSDVNGAKPLKSLCDDSSYYFLSAGSKDLNCTNCVVQIGDGTCTCQCCRLVIHVTIRARVHVYVCIYVPVALRRCGGGCWRQGEPIDRPVRGAARSSRSSCPLGVKDTDVTALITEAGSQRYQHSQQQLSRTLLR